MLRRREESREGELREGRERRRNKRGKSEINEGLKETRTQSTMKGAENIRGERRGREMRGGEINRCTAAASDCSKDTQTHTDTHSCSDVFRGCRTEGAQRPLFCR